MSTTNSLDSVIRVAASDDVAGFGQKIVLVDALKRMVLPSKPWFRDVRSFLVSNSGDARHVGTGALTAHQLQDLEHKLEVSLKFELRCPPGNEERLVLALFDPIAPPAMVIQRYLGRWLSELGKAGIPRFVDAYFANRQSLEAQLAARAETELGLDMTVLLTLDAERSLNPIDVEEDRLVLVRDFDDDEVYLQFRVGVDVDPANRITALLRCDRYAEIHDLVPREIDRFIRENVTMQTFCTLLNSPAVRDPLTRHLNEVLQPFGRKVRTLTLIGEEFPPELQYLQDEVDVFCRLHQYPRQVKISNKVQMNLIDLARYRTAKSPPLKEWLRQNLERFVPQLLFETRYIDVLLRFEDIEQQIKQKLSEHAAAIGYELKQFVIVRDLEPIKWKEPFLVSAEGEFQTQHSDLSVKLVIEAVVRIPRLEAIEDKLNSDQHVPTLMSKAMKERVRQYLHNIDPERYYMRFDFSDVSGEVPVQTAIEEAIRQELTGQTFHAEVISIAVKPVEDELMARLKTLQQQIGMLHVEVESLHANDPIVFEGKFHVEAVASDVAAWYRFRSRRYSIEEIRTHLEDHLRAELQTRPVEEILFRHAEEQELLVKQLRYSALGYARGQFGLAIGVDSISRKMTKIEQKVIQERDDKLDARLTIDREDLDRELRMHRTVNDEREAQLIKLLQERTRLTAREDTDDEVAELDVKIAKARKNFVKVPVPAMLEVKAAILPERSGNGKARQFLTGATEPPPPADQPTGESK